MPDAAHGTNPATATMCGFTVREIPTDRDGNVDLEQLRAAVGPQTAGLMLTNPSTLGVFEQKILDIRDIVHAAGGLLYYDGANLNAILGKVKPGAMGFDVIHMNLHKTFSTPHGGGGPGAGPVGVAPHLEPFLPIPMVGEDGGWLPLADRGGSAAEHRPTVRAHGQCRRAAARLRLCAHARPRRHAARGRIRTLNANYLMAELRRAGFDVAFPQAPREPRVHRHAQAAEGATGVTAMDFAKRLLDKGFHAPTTYFPLLVPECLLIEPTETESKETLDAFVAAMKEILEEAHTTARSGEERAAHHAGAPAGRRQGRARAGPRVEEVSDDQRSPHKGKTGLRRIWNALFYSIAGFKAAYPPRGCVPSGSVCSPRYSCRPRCFLPANGLGKAMMVASVLLVLVVELLNSAVEATVDRISLENHQLAKRAKDIGSAAVFVSLLNVVVVWGLVLFG